jgi:hypothetical protein
MRRLKPIVIAVRLLFENVKRCWQSVSSHAQL